MTRIVIVEDEIVVAHFMAELVKKMGCEVVEVLHRLENAVETISRIRPDILLLDINLGTPKTKKAGIAIAEALKDQGILTIFVTAYGNDAVIKEAIRQNPENYIIKPFTEETIRIALKLAISKIRHKIEESTSIALCPGYAFHPQLKQLTGGHGKIALSATELRALEFFCRNPNRVIAHEALQEALWEHKSVSGAAVRELLFRLRKKIPCLNLQNHPGVGYALMLE